MRTVLKLSAFIVAIAWFTTFGASKASAFTWMVPDFEPVGVVSGNGRQLDLKLVEIREGEPVAAVRVGVQIDVFQPDTGAVGTGWWEAPYKSRYSLWTRSHALGDSPRFAEGYVIVRARGVMWERNQVVATWEWWSVVYLMPDDA
jgi:hypothetical protein